MNDPTIETKIRVEDMPLRSYLQHRERVLNNQISGLKGRMAFVEAEIERIKAELEKVEKLKQTL
jgi:hypothetical protein